MSALTTALEQLDRAIAAVDQAFSNRLATLEQQQKELSAQCELERTKNRQATQDLAATIAQLETYLQRTGSNA